MLAEKSKNKIIAAILMPVREIKVQTAYFCGK
jgi:hypothetical protein